MRTTIDSAGRVVIPKSLREAAGLTGTSDVEIVLRDGHIEIDIPATPMSLEERGGGAVAVPEGALPTLRQSHVRDVLETVRR